MLEQLDTDNLYASFKCFNENNIKVIDDTIKTLEEKRKKIASNEVQVYLNILLKAMIIGCDFRIKHGMTAPYCHEYYIVSRSNKYIDHEYFEPVTCSKDWKINMPKALYRYLVEKKSWAREDFYQLLVRTDIAWKKLEEHFKSRNYIPNAYEPSSNYVLGRHIATGYETDGFENILAGKCMGTYSSMTTSMQNDLAMELIQIKYDWLKTI